jgi:hypothetical protein
MIFLTFFIEFLKEMIQGFPTEICLPTYKVADDFNGYRIVPGEDGLCDVYDDQRIIIYRKGKPVFLATIEIFNGDFVPDGDYFGTSFSSACAPARKEPFLDGFQPCNFTELADLSDDFFSWPKTILTGILWPNNKHVSQAGIWFKIKNRNNAPEIVRLLGE